MTAPTPLRTVPPGSEAFREACHRMVDRLLDKHPEADAALFAVCWEKGHAMASVPSAHRVKVGVVDGLYDELHPETAE